MTTNLNGLKVLVTRPLDQGKNLCQLINSYGGQAISYPTIEIMPSKHLDKNQLQEVLSWATHVVFISRNAVSVFRHTSVNLSESLNGKLVISTGKGTELELQNFGIQQAVFPLDQSGSEAVLELPELNEPMIKDKNILIIRGDDGRELLRETLLKRGANIRYANVYTRKIPEVSPAVTETIWHDTIPDIIIVTSNQGLHNLIEMTGVNNIDLLYQQKIVVMSNRVAESAKSAGFTHMPIVADDQSDEGLIEAIERSME